jgi:hypothetical protein
MGEILIVKIRKENIIRPLEEGNLIKEECEMMN